MPIGTRTVAASAALLALATTAAAAADIPGDASTKATLKTGAPGVKGGKFEKRGDSDWYRVALKGGQNYAVHLASTDECGAAVINLRDPRGRVVASADAYVYRDGGDEYRPTRDGTYFLEFKEAGGRCETYPATYAGEVVGDARNDVTTDAVLQLGKTLTPRFNYGYDRDDYRMALKGGASYSLTEKGGLDLFVQVLDAKGKELFQIYNALNATTHFKVPKSGTYFLAVENDADAVPSGSGGIPYTLKLTSP